MDRLTAATRKTLRTAEWGRRLSAGQRSPPYTKAAMAKTPAHPGIESAMQDQIVALKQKIHLLEYDHREYQESASNTIDQNQEAIKLLQQENKTLNREIALEKKRHADREAKGGPVVIQLREGKLYDTIKRLNALRHQAEVRMKHLEELESMLKKNATITQNKAKTTEKEEIQRLLENKIEEVRLKLQDAEHINSVYRKMVNHLQEELPMFTPQIQQLETETLLFKNELKDLKILNKNAVMSRDSALAEHKDVKKKFRCNRRNKKTILHELSRQANEMRLYKKEQATSGVFTVVQAPDNAYVIFSTQDKEGRVAVNKEALQKIKEATGALNKCEVLQRYIKQEETRKYLEKEKLIAEITLGEIKDKQEKMDNARQELKYSGQAKLQVKLSNNLKTLEELRIQLQLESEKHDKFKMEAEKTGNILNKVTSEVKRLAIRLRYIKVSETNLPVMDLSLDLHVLDILSIIGQRLQKFKKQLEGQDVEKLFTEMKGEKFPDTIKCNVPASNLLISLLSPTEQGMSDDEDSEEDNDVMSRTSIKKISKQVIMSNRRASLWSEKWVEQ
ncbi:outer dynein arm-docking complex subunit 3-like [Dendropsophus ebraccatus]|uniref:outer dynein arm-docking complex subunit 3-like n=1 Tax=Dendropsophus ebraccatus TaxID=150705 RepID=UPI003831FB30